MFLHDYGREPHSLADFFDGLGARAARIELENPPPPPTRGTSWSL